MAAVPNSTQNIILGVEKCESYLLFHGETGLGAGLRTFLYSLGLAYCFLGLSAITGRFFRSMEHVVKHSRKVVEVDPYTGAETVRHEKVWNFAIADISLLAFGTSFPQISLATIDAIRNIGNLYAGGLGPGTLVGSAAFDLFPIHAVCVVVPKAGELKKISDLGVWLVELFWSFWAYVWLYIILEVWTPNVITLWEALLTVLQYGLLLTHAYAQDKRWPYLSLPLERSERPEEWVPAEIDSRNAKDDYSQIHLIGEDADRDVVDIFSIHSSNVAAADLAYQKVPGRDDVAESSNEVMQEDAESGNSGVFTLWKQQFLDAFTLERAESKKMNCVCLRFARISWELLLAPWRIMFAFVPPYTIAHGWIAFISSLIFISGIAYIVTKLTDMISCVTGINPYVIAFTALAAGTSWPDLVASKIAAERQTTADSAIANITCSIMECLLHASTTVIFRRAIPQKAWKSNTNGRLRAKVNDEIDPILQSAINAASIRHQETHRQEPLFLDPYAGCFRTNEGDLDTNQCSVHYAIATKFIDDKLLDTVDQIDGLNQVVLLTDGMDTRPYRLSWPKSTIMFDISLDEIFNPAAEKLEGVGAKVPRGCLFRHVSLESDCIQQSLRAKGFNGNLPSIWAIQGLPLMSLSSFEEILVIVSSLATNGCFFLGELPALLVETEMEIRDNISQWVEKVFLSNGFRVNVISLEKVATSLGKSLVPAKCNNLLFVAEQLRFSDDQMEKWRSVFQRVEEDADEEGFEEL